MDTYAPTFIVEIDGQELPEDISQSVETFSYEDHDEKMDELKLRIFDEHMAFVDHPQLQLGKDVRARWGYVGNLSPVKISTIKEINYTFGENGAVIIDVRAFDKGHKLTGRSARTCWKDRTVAAVVSDIAAKHGLAAVVSVPDDPSRESLSQGGKNDMEFLRELAQDTGCAFWVENEELHFEPDKVPAPSMTFRFREDRDGYLMSMSVRVNAEKGKAVGTETESAGLDPLTKAEIKETSSAKGEGVTVNLVDGREQPETPHQAKDDETGRVIPTPAPTAQQAKREAKGLVEKAGMHCLEARARTVGLPGLKAKQSVTVENIGSALSGDWRVKKVRHEISRQGYVCDLELVRNDTSGGGGAPKTQAASTGAPPAGSSTSSAPPPLEVNLG